MINKYRIYDKEYAEYCEEPDWRWMLSREGKLYNSKNDKWYTVGERFLVEFFTGEKDLNDVEIYDGDIIFVNYNHIGKINVKFESGSFNICKYNTAKLQIIGNIHKKYFCKGCEELVTKLENYSGHELCRECSENYDNKTGHCSLSCSLGNGCDQTC